VKVTLLVKVSIEWRILNIFEKKQFSRQPGVLFVHIIKYENKTGLEWVKPNWYQELRKDSLKLRPFYIISTERYGSRCA